MGMWLNVTQVRHSPPHRSSLLALLGLAIITFGGCASAVIPSDRSINRDKLASVAEWSSIRVGHESAEAYAWDRAALIIQGADGILPNPSTGTGTGRAVRFSPTLNGQVVTRASAGAAAAISSDGYWLTAAHCTEPGPLMIVRVDRDGELRSWPARIVWQAPHEGVESTMKLPADRDLALLHTPVEEPIPAFVLSPTPPQRGRILCIGSGVGTNAWSAGRITGISGRINDDVTLVHHDAPVSFGDSGGPAMLDDGLLVGVNVERAWGFLSPDESTAVWIKPEVLQDLMDADRLQRGIPTRRANDPAASRSPETNSPPLPAEAANDAGL